MRTGNLKILFLGLLASTGMFRALPTTTYALVELAGTVANDVNNAGEVVGHSLTGWVYGVTNKRSIHFDARFLGDPSIRYSGISPISVNAINDSGVLAGQLVLVGGISNAFVYGRTGPAIILPQGTTANGINAGGTVVGSGTFDQGRTRTAFIYDGTNVLTLAQDSPKLYAINDAGLAVGSVAPRSGDDQAASFVHGNAEMLNLAGLAALIHPGRDIKRTSVARSVNNAGQIVGQISHPRDTNAEAAGFAFRYTDGVATDLGSLGGNLADARGINNHGVIVGTSGTKETNSYFDDNHAFIYTGGKMVDLNDLVTSGADGWILTSANAISDTGFIVGQGIKVLGPGTAAGKAAFLLKPLTDDLLPAITRQPASAEKVFETVNPVLPGDGFSISVRAAGIGPLSYQWQKDGTNITGAVLPVFSVAGSTPSDAGIYRAVVSNPAGSVTSKTISIKVVNFTISISGSVSPGRLVFSVAGPDRYWSPASGLLQTTSDLGHPDWQTIGSFYLNHYLQATWTTVVKIDQSATNVFHRVVPSH